MGLLITRLELHDFRSYQQFEMEPDAGLTLIVGPNAVGKTNLIEALQLVTAAESFRRPVWQDLVRWGEDEARVILLAEGDGRQLTTELAVVRGRREYRVNGKSRKTAPVAADRIPAVVFTPDDLRLVKDAAEKRRSALDSLGGQLSAGYGSVKSQYDRILRQRNAALKDGGGDIGQMGALTEQLVDMGTKLRAARERLLHRMVPAMSEAYRRISGEDLLEAEYVPSWRRDGIEPEGDEPDQERMHLRLKEAEERSRGTTLVGPHRDEIRFMLDRRDARAFASQGEQRTIALSWKLAEVSVITEIAGQAPVLLLDDVMSELDELRRHALAEQAGTTTQTIATTTNKGYLEQHMIDRAKVIELP